jgi:hypothetical protein
MSEEKKQYTCPCGSVVLQSNKKAHERTKKHQNFSGVNNEPVVRAQKPLLPPMPVRSSRRAIEEDDEPEEEDDEYHSGEDGDDGDADTDVDELMEAVDHLLESNQLIAEQVQNLSNSVPANFELLKKRVDEVESNILKSLKDFVVMYNEHRQQGKQVYLNDKCTPPALP